MRRQTREPEQAPLRPLKPVEDVFDRILEHVIDLDPEAEFEALRFGLKLAESGSAATPGAIQDALEEAQDMARRAHELYCHVAVNVERSSVDLRVIESTLRERAVAELKDERNASIEYDEKGKPIAKPKQITEGDVKAYADVHFTDEVRSIEGKRVGNKMILENAEQLSKLWRDRAKTLESLAGSRRGRGTFEP